MAKYIERETLISALESEFEDNENCRLFVSEIPTADVVEVVRCKDCKHAKLDIYEKGLVVCRRPVLKNGQLLPFNLETTYNDYCSYGELKECEGK